MRAVECELPVRAVTVVRAAPSKCLTRDFLTLSLFPFLLSAFLGHSARAPLPSLFAERDRPSKRRYRIRATFIFSMARARAGVRVTTTVMREERK